VLSKAIAEKVTPLAHEDDDDAEEDESAPPVIRRPTQKAPLRPKYDKTIHSSSDSEEDDGSISPKRLPLKTAQNKLFLSDDDEEEGSVAAVRTQERKTKTFLLPRQQESDESDNDAENGQNTSERTEDIEQYADDSQPHAFGAGASTATISGRELGWNEPKEEEEGKAKGAEKAPRKPSQKDLDAIHAVEAAQRRRESLHTRD
jgi:hypothetical protein